MMKKFAKRLCSAVLAIVMICTIAPWSLIPVNAASDSVTLYQYTGTGSSKVAGSLYTNAQGKPAKVIITKTGKEGGCLVGTVRLENVNAIKGLDNCLYSGNYQLQSVYSDFANRSTLYFKMDNDWIMISTEKDKIHGKYFLLGKVHGGPEISKITKIDTFKYALDTVYARSCRDKRFKDFTRVARLDGSAYFKTDLVKVNSVCVSQDQALPTTSTKITKPSSGKSTTDNYMRTGPGVDYPYVTEVSLNSVEDAIVEDGFSADSAGGMTLDSASAKAVVIKSGEVLGISKVENGWGQTTYKGYTGWVNLNYYQRTGALIFKPEPPTVRLDTSPDIPATGTITVSWNPVDHAKYYKAVLCNSTGKEVKVYDNFYDTSVTFSPADEGIYTVKIYAQNSMYTSDAGVLAQAIHVHGKSKVTYVDYNGDVIGTQDVSYNNSSTAPLAPERKGYTFYGWSDTASNVKGDKVITAEYKINEYPVKFFDREGHQIGNTQYVKYNESAVPPTTDEIPEVADYSFVGWSSDDYKNVYKENKNEPIEIHAVYVYDNTEIPVSCTITEAARQKDGYNVIFNIKNHVNDITSGRAVVALKTASDKLVYTTESAAFSIKGGATKTGMEVFVPCNDAASKVEIIILDKFETSIPISEVVSSEIDQSGMWTDWIDYTTLPDFDDDTEHETRTAYCYRTKKTTTYHTNKKVGWTLYGTRTSNVGAWSAWTDSIVDAFDYPEKTREVKTQVVNTYSTRTVYDYFHYYNYSTGKSSPVQYTNFSGPHTISITWQLSHKGNSNVSGWCHYGTHGCGSCSSSNYWYPNGSRSESYVSGNKTQYSYRDTTYTYYFYKWPDDYSPWQGEPVTATASRQVKTKKQYRTQSVSDLVEDDSGVSRSVSGTLDTSLAGKKINLYVVKYNANSDFTNEYVGQTTIKDDGSYSFSFKLREELSAETGDMVAYIGIQGTEKMQAVKVFEAPKAKYKVEYFDDIDTDEPISVQYVEEENSAVVPATNPEKEGYIFAGWNNTCTNVCADMEVRPIFVKKQYVIQYIDPRNSQNNKTDTVEHGEPLDITMPTEDCDSGFARGWDIIEENRDNDEATVATSNSVLVAEYETKMYDVTFEGINGEIIDVVEVEHEGFVELPEFPEEDGVEFIEWSVTDDELTEVTESVTVTPVFCYEETTAEPVNSLESGAYVGSKTVTLTPETENDVIWYTLDGSNPAENPEAIEYTGPFKIHETTTLSYYAGSFGKNDSGIVTCHYVLNNVGKLVTIESSLYPEYDVTFIVDSLAEIDEDLYEEEGYTFTGFYYDEACTNKANLATDTTGSTVTLYAGYTANSYTVKFCDSNGLVIETQTLPYGSEVTPPEMSDKGELKFVGWDSDAYVFFSEDATVTAIYKPASEITTVTLNRNNVAISEKSTYNLTATVESLANPELGVIWVSDNTDIATVNDIGEVTGVSAGTTTIFAVAEDDSAYAMCTVTVEPNTNYSLVINTMSYLGLDSAGYLRGVKVGENTVADIKKHFNNSSSSLSFVNENGDTLDDESLVGTGVVVRLMNNGKVLDKLTIVMTGDVNGDGKVNLMDSSKVSRFLVSKETFEYVQTIAADVNGDGKLNLRDAAYICRYTVGKETL